MNPIFLPHQLAQSMPWDGAALPPSTPIHRGMVQGVQSFDPETAQVLDQLSRGEFTGDINAFLQQFALTMGGMQRAITSATTGLPIRENLEAPAIALTPMDTPMRNRIPRKPGSGTAKAWRQLTGNGAGYGVYTTVTSGASSATQTVGSTAGMRPGDSLYFATTNAYRIVSSITNATTVVLTATISTTTSEVVTKGPYAQPDIGASGALRAFFSESGAPADHTGVYAAKSSSYKLMGVFGSITGFAMAAGASFGNQMAMEKTNSLRSLMLNEENAIINGSSSSTAAPWGDGSTAFGFDGLVNLVATGNGTPADQVQASVGALTFAHVDQQLARQHTQGAQSPYILVNGQEAMSMKNLAQASGSIQRVVIKEAASAAVGWRVSSYIHPITGEEVPVITSRFLPAGTIIFGCDRLPEGDDALEMSVLPQTQLPDLAPNQMIQGYVAQELAPTTSAVQVYPWIVTVFEVLCMKSAVHFCKSTGVTAV